MHWSRNWQPTPVFLPGESQGRGSLVGSRLWGGTESDTTEATQQQQQHTVKGFGTVNKAEIDVFLELTGSSAFSKSRLNNWKFMVHVLLKPGLETFEHYFVSM